MNFDWDEFNIAHIAEHDVAPHEAEETYNNNPLYLDYTVEGGELRHREIGETLSGRILVVVSTMRGDLVRVVTAYPAERPLRITYLAFKEFEQRGRESHS
jgi:uncharacterized DUF497 family protein